MATTTPALGIQNYFSTTLSAPIVATDTIIFLNTLPTPTQGFLVLNLGGANQEVIFYTSKGANYVQCTSVADGRGQDNTSAAAHSAGESVKMTVTAGYWQALQNMTGVTAGAVGAIPFATGWATMPAVTPNTITYNGNRNYSVVFNSTDLTSYISNGMRLKLTRTVTAPTQCTSLNGTTQFYNRASASVTGMSFTTTTTVMAWIKLASYNGASQAIMSRHNGTNGFLYFVNSSGQLNFQIASGSASVTYQSVPLNKWVHVAASYNAGTVVHYIDGVLVSSTGTPTASVTQAGNFEIGSYNGGLLPFNGKIAQAAIFSAVINQATIQGYISQGLAGTETSLISAYSFNNSINDLNANANNLTANGSAVATNADSPFTQDDTGTPLGTTDFGIVTKKVFSTNTTLTVQVPEGCAIPTSGGVSALSYSTQRAPYGFPTTRNRWRIDYPFRANISQTTLTGGQWNNMIQLPAFPTGDFIVGYQLTTENVRAATGTLTLLTTLSTSNNSETDGRFTYGNGVNAATDQYFSIAAQADVSLAAPTTYYINTYYDGATGARTGIFILGNANQGRSMVWAELASL